MEVQNITPPNLSSNPVIPPSNIPPKQNRFLELWDGFKTFYIANKWYVWAAVLGVVILSLLAYFAFRPNKVVPKPAKIDLTVEANEVVPSGGEQVYKVKIGNQDSTALVSMELELVYPEGVKYDDSTPKATNLSGSVFPVPDLEPGQNVVVIVKTTVQGEINEEKKLLVRLHYRFKNSGADFVTETTQITKLVAADVSIEISGTNQTNNASVVNYEVRYKNNSDKDISNARIKIDYPSGFTFASSSPEPNLSKNIWNIGNLIKDQEGKISFQGSFQGSSSGQSQTFTASFLVLDNNGSYFTQASSDFSTTIGSLPLVVTQSLTSNAGRTSVSAGDTLDYTIKYQNTAAVAARGVNIVLTIDSPAVDLSSIEAEGAQVNNNTVTWNASSSSDLEVLNPNESGSVRFTINVNNPPVKDSRTNITVKTSVKIKSDEYDSFLPGNDLSLKVSTIASLERSLDYVSGSLPPHVGKQTVYRLTLGIRNGTNELRDGILTAFVTLPSGSYDSASIQPIKEAANVSFDSSTGKLTWRLGTVSSHLGDFNPVRKVSFTLKLTPSQSQSGKEVTLLKNISAVLKDPFTGESRQLSAEDITTATISGGNFENGIVQ